MMRNSSGYGTNGKNAAGEDIRETISYPIYQTLVASNQTLTGLAACAPIGGSVNVVVDGRAELASAFIVSGNYYQVLNIQPEVGRLLTPEDDNDAAPPVVVISHAYWKKRFATDPGIIGKVVTMGKLTFTIVGVTRPEFTGSRI